MTPRELSITDYNASLVSTLLSTPRSNREKKEQTTALIVNAVPTLRELFNQTINFEHMVPDDGEILKHLFNAIAQEREAKEEIEYCCMALIADSMAADTSRQARQLGNILRQLGTHLLNEMQTLNAYHRGYLNWKFGGFIGNDILLVRRIPDHDVV
jgi:hypothetical protein